MSDLTITTAQPDLFCPNCGYNLRGLDRDRCPECGKPFDRSLLSSSRIPWVHRRALGGITAYWRTVAFVLRHPLMLAGEMGIPVSFEHARRFRRATLLLVLVPLVAASAGFFIEALLDPSMPLATKADRYAPTKPYPFTKPPQPTWRDGRIIGWVLEIGTLPVAWMGVWLFLCSATGAVGLFFRPKRMAIRQQNRAVAISCYSCAPLAFTPVLVGGAAALLRLARVDMPPALDSVIPVGSYAVGVLAGLELLLWWAMSLLLLRRTTQCTWRRVTVAGLGLPVAWSLLGVAMVIGIPMGYLFVSLVVLSLL